MTLSDVKTYFRTVIKVVAGGPAVGTPGSNRAQGVLDALDKLAEFVQEQGGGGAGGVTAEQLATVATTLPITATRSAAYTLQLSDAGCLVPVASSNAVTVTVPANSAVAFPVGTTLYVAQDGAGQVTIAAASGVAVRTADGYNVPGQWQEVSLHKRDLNTWVLKGGIS